MDIEIPFNNIRHLSERADEQHFPQILVSGICCIALHATCLLAIKVLVFLKVYMSSHRPNKNLNKSRPSLTVVHLCKPNNCTARLFY